jgi:predicted cupin superfamily sugar epimerase
MLISDAAFWIEKLGLEPHPEGGFYRQVYRAGEFVEAEALPDRFGGRRAFSTSIYFLLRAGDVSRFHRLKSDEIWHYHDGRPLLLHILEREGEHRAIRLGKNSETGEAFQAVVPAGLWFGAEVDAFDGFSLVGCTLAPGFDFADFELARREPLLAEFPAHEDLIRRLTKL